MNVKVELEDVEPSIKENVETAIHSYAASKSITAEVCLTLILLTYQPLICQF